MTSKSFNRRVVGQKKDNLEQKPLQKDMTWEKQIEEMIKFGYPYEIACAIVSKRRIRELFEKDVKVHCGK